MQSMSQDEAAKLHELANTMLPYVAAIEHELNQIAHDHHKGNEHLVVVSRIITNST
jgi:hypothetical protein